MKAEKGAVKWFQVALAQVCIGYFLTNAGKAEAHAKENGYCNFYKNKNNTENFLWCFNLTGFPKNNVETLQTVTSLVLANGGKNLKVLKDGALLEAHLSNLNHLWLFSDGIQQIEIGAFRGGSKFKLLNLYRNNITELDPNVFADLPNLKLLSICKNPITGFLKDSEFPRLLNLSILEINSGQLRTIPPNLFKNLHNLKTLDLSKNQLTMLPWTLFKPMKKLTHVSIDGNPFACDCHLTETIQYLHHKNIVWSRAGLVSKQPPSCISANNTTVFITSLENMTWSCPAQNRPKLLKQEVATDNFIHSWEVIIGGVLAVVSSVLLAILALFKFQTRIKLALKKFFKKFQVNKNGVKRDGMANIQQP